MNINPIPNIIDTTGFPVRKVIRVREAKGQAVAMGVKRFLTLVCGHEVGQKDGHEVPTEVRCFNCSKGAA